MAIEKLALRNKVTADQCTLEAAGQVFKHVVIALRDRQEIAMVLETPELWTGIQGDRAKCLSRGDTASIISSDGLVIADRAMVVKSEGGRLWWSAPQRLVRLEETALFEDAQHRVIACGTGYAIESKRGGHVERDRVYNSVESARFELARRQPSRVA